ncbi:MAG TPA: PmoA family protein [Sphingobacterium sp.]|nr:PmoA family protein [Sphingobacterium sp.]
MKQYNILTLLFSLFAFTTQAQRVATLEVTTTGKEKFGIPMQIDLDALTHAPDSSLQFVELKNGIPDNTLFQIEASGNNRTLHWILLPSSTTKRIFELVQTDAPKQPLSPRVQVTENDGALTISSENKDLLQYNVKTIYPPAGVDTVYRRSGFIHPLNTPSGHALTRINAADHYHHWGMWNPWTRVDFEGETLDFWNLADRKGTVRFGGLAAIEKGDVYAKISTLHEHVAFKKDGSKKTAINEIHSMKIYRMHPADPYYILDITSQLSCATSGPVTLLEYRYGGLGIRATEQWTRDNSVTLTSEGKDRKEADGSLARWVVAHGSLGNDHGGLEMMSHPTNYNHPEPLRVWPESSNGRGDVFLNFSPTKNKDWLLEPGKTYLLKYRFLIFDGKLSKEEAEEVWQSFAYPPAIEIRKDR